MLEEDRRFLEGIIREIYDHFCVDCNDEIMLDIMVSDFWDNIHTDSAYYDNYEDVGDTAPMNEFIYNTMLKGYKHYNKYADCDYGFVGEVEINVAGDMYDQYEDTGKKTRIRLDTGEIKKVPIELMAGEIVRVGGTEKDKIDIRNILFNHGLVYVKVDENSIYNRDEVGVEILDYLRANNCPGVIYNVLYGKRSSSVTNTEVFGRARKNKRVCNIVNSMKSIIEASGKIAVLLKARENSVDDIDILSEVVYRASRYTEKDLMDNKVMGSLEAVLNDLGVESYDYSSVDSFESEEQHINYISKHIQTLVTKIGIEVCESDIMYHMCEGMSVTRALATGYLEYVYYLSGRSKRDGYEYIKGFKQRGKYEHGHMLYESELNTSFTLKSYIISALDKVTISEKEIDSMEKAIIARMKEIKAGSIKSRN